VEDRTHKRSTAQLALFRLGAVVIAFVLELDFDRAQIRVEVDDDQPVVPATSRSSPDLAGH
jgi:hypothetical protein